MEVGKDGEKPAEGLKYSDQKGGQRVSDVLKQNKAVFHQRESCPVYQMLQVGYGRSGLGTDSWVGQCEVTGDLQRGSFGGTGVKKEPDWICF